MKSTSTGEAASSISRPPAKSPSSFAATERRRQLAYFDKVAPDRQTHDNIPYRFMVRADNLAPSISDAADCYFRQNAITWHTHSNHMLSSQACCLNFLMPLAGDPARLSKLVGKALGIAPPRMLGVETGPDGKPWYVGFEWVGAKDYLGEAGKSGTTTRGANCTSADAFMKFEHGGRVEGLLVEWKYTESYGSPLHDGSRIYPGESEARGGHATRRGRYSNLMVAPDGPLIPRATLKLDDFFYEPFYQLLRQQMLAHQMERHGEADVVRVLHISPRGNSKLHAVTSPTFKGLAEADAFAVFRSLLAKPDRFISHATEDLFGGLLAAAPSDDPWSTYIQQRYAFMTNGSTL